MNKFAKVVLIIAAVCAGIGVVLCSVGAAFGATIGDVTDITGIEGKDITGIEHISNWFDRITDGESWSWHWDGDNDDWIHGSSVNKEEYTFKKDEIENFDLSVAAGYLKLAKADSKDEIKVKIYTKKSTVKCSKEGNTLEIKDDKTYRNSHVEVMVYIPDNMKLDDMKVDVAAGKVVTDIDELKTETASINVDAGEGDISHLQVNGKLTASVAAGKIKLKDIMAGKAMLDCGMGEMKMNGSVAGNITADCGMGNMKLKLDGDSNDYNYDLSCGLGSVKVDGKSYSSINNKKEIDNNADKKMSLDCGVGNLEVKF